MHSFHFILVLMTAYVAVLVVVVALLAHQAGYLDRLLAMLGTARSKLFALLGLERDGLVVGEVDSAMRRMWPLWLLFAACFVVVIFLNPMKAGLIIYGIGKIALAGPLGYLIDYCATARKDRPENQAEGIGHGLARKNRTWVICFTIVALAVGVP